MTEQLLFALENVLKDSVRLAHLQLHFSQSASYLRGSVFNIEFVSNYLELMKYISKQISLKNYILKINEDEVVLTFDTNSEIVGFDALLSLSELSEDELKRIVWRKRFGFNVRSINKEAPETTKIRAIFRGIENLELKTIFPGTYAPPFPEKTIQKEGEYKRSKEFWDQHVLLF